MATLNDSTQNAVGELTNIAGNLSLPIGKTFTDYIRSAINYAIQKAEDSIATLDPGRMSTGRMEEYKVRARNEFLAPFTQNLFGLGMQLLNFEKAGEQWKAQHLLTQEKFNFDKNAAEEEAARNRIKWDWEKQAHQAAQSGALSGLSKGSNLSSVPSSNFFESQQWGDAKQGRNKSTGGGTSQDQNTFESYVGAGGRFPGSQAEKDYLSSGPSRVDFSNPAIRSYAPFQSPIKKGIQGSFVPPPVGSEWI